MESDFNALKALAEGQGVPLSQFVRELVSQSSPVKLQPLRGRGAEEGNRNARRRQKETLPTCEDSFQSGHPKTKSIPAMPGQNGTAALKTTTVTLWLRVENNNKFVRGKKRARENIENYHLRRYGMKKLSDWEYELTFSYVEDADLDRQVYDLLREIAFEADLRLCFTETDVRENGTDHSW